MKECRGDQTIKISQSNNSPKERFSTPPNPYQQVYITQVYNFTGVYYTSHRCILSQVYITHPLKKKKDCEKLGSQISLQHIFSPQRDITPVILHAYCFSVNILCPCILKNPLQLCIIIKAWSEVNNSSTAHTHYILQLTVCVCMCVRKQILTLFS